MIATWNLCLGLSNTKDYVHQTLHEQKIDVCLLQEEEIEKDFPLQLITSKNYKLEVENNSRKARCAIAFKDNIKYTRRNDLDDIDLGFTVIDINNLNNNRLIKVYH